MQLSEINIYPVKSLKGISLNEAMVEDRGLRHDRRWMLVDEKEPVSDAAGISGDGPDNGRNSRDDRFMVGIDDRSTRGADEPVNGRISYREDLVQHGQVRVLSGGSRSMVF